MTMIITRYRKATASGLTHTSTRPMSTRPERPEGQDPRRDDGRHDPVARITRAPDDEQEPGERR